MYIFSHILRLPRLTAYLQLTSPLRPLYSGSRGYASAPEKDLKETLKEIIPKKREMLKKFKAEHGQKTLCEVKVENAIGGMRFVPLLPTSPTQRTKQTHRGIKGMLWEGSVLDANEGIRFHGKTIKECQSILPKGKTGQEMLPEGMFWLLLTGQVPTEGQVRVLSRTFAENAALPEFVEKMMDAFPTTLHPMTQMAIAVAALNHDSKFARMYEKGLAKADYWEPTFDDSIMLLSKLPTIAAKIYQNTYNGGGPLPGKVDLTQDWSWNFAAMLGKADSEGFVDLLRLYLALHGDHEGGNVSAHATHLVGSALSDPFLSYSAGLQGLAGPLHGLAAQEVLRFIQKMKMKIGSSYSDQDVKDYLWSLLKSGQVIPGYGHAVLRKPDPRFQALMDFAATRKDVAEGEVFKLVKKNSDIAPGVLLEHGKTKVWISPTTTLNRHS